MQRTLEVLETLWQRGYRYFLCGGATGFDTLAASCVCQLRLAHPDVRLVLVLPCSDQTRSWSAPDKGLYEQLREDADHVLILAPHYFTGCMMVRNRFMVDHASRCIAYMREPIGGTAYTIRYAIQSGLPVLNLALSSEVRLFLEDPAPQDAPLPF